MNYSPQLLISRLSVAETCQRLVVAFSGGLDSMVLLHSLHELAKDEKLHQQVAAIHINHGINKAAEDWQAFCEATCRRMQIPLQTVQLNLGSEARDNLEDRARVARYREFKRLLTSDDCLVMGHHLDDQMETLLLRLMRGSGPAGLMAISPGRTLGKSSLIRPLLTIDRNALRQYAMKQNLNWVEDETNQSIDIDRNFLRHEILPLIEKRWPGYRKSWQKVLQLSREAAEIQLELAAIDFQAVATEQPQIISLGPLLELSEPRQRNLLRYWLGRIGFPELGWQQLFRLSSEIIPARRDASARLVVNGGSLRRYKDNLFALSDCVDIDVCELAWNLSEQKQLELPDNGKLILVRTANNTERLGGKNLIRTDIGSVSLKYRNGGEKFKAAGRPTKTLKGLLQEAGVPPWMRNRYPLLFSGEDLIAVPGIGVTQKFAASEGIAGYAVSWEPPDILYSLTPD